MQFIKCSRDAILEPLRTVGGIVQGRQTIPILYNVLISKQGATVDFISTDTEIQVKTSADIGTGDEDFRTTLPSAKLTQLLSGLPNTEIEMIASSKNVTLRSSAPISTFGLSQLPAEEFPVLSASDVKFEFSIPSKDLLYLLQMVQFAMAQQDLRYYLNGVLLEVSEGLIRVVATDSHRLACCDFPCAASTPEGRVQVILPRKSVLQLIRLLGDTDAVVQVGLGDNQALFSFGKIEFLTKLIDGRYPDYSRVIPTNNDKAFLVNREELIGALRRAAILANDKFRGLRWKISPGSLHIMSSNSDGENADEEIIINYEGESLDLGFNVNYLIDVLVNLKNSDVKFSFSTAQGASLITMPESELFRYVLMPMRI